MEVFVLEVNNDSTQVSLFANEDLAYEEAVKIANQIFVGYDAHLPTSNHYAIYNCFKDLMNKKRYKDAFNDFIEWVEDADIEADIFIYPKEVQGMPIIKMPHKGGMSCCKCGEYNEYAEPNCGDANYKCYKCGGKI